MEKSNAKVYAVIALVVAVIALSIGFAAFSATLTIENATATVKANNEFTPNVYYTSNANDVKCYYTGETTSTVPNAVKGTAGASGSEKTWTGISVPLESGHYSVTCEAKIENASNYIAYLKSISTNSQPITCASTAGGSDAATNVSTICNSTKVEVYVGSAPAEKAQFTNGANSTHTNTTNAAYTSTTSSIAAINGSTNGSETVFVTIAYTGSIAADGDVTVTIPTISLIYSTAQ